MWRRCPQAAHRLSELLDLARNDGKPAAGLAGARGLDRRVEGQDVGLLGDGGDRADDVADGRGVVAQFAGGRGRRLRLADTSVGHVRGVGRGADDLTDR